MALMTEQKEKTMMHCFHPILVNIMSHDLDTLPCCYSNVMIDFKFYPYRENMYLMYCEKGTETFNAPLQQNFLSRNMQLSS